MQQMWRSLIKSTRLIQTAYNRYLWERELLFQKYRPEVFLQIEDLIKLDIMSIIRDSIQHLPCDVTSHYQFDSQLPGNVIIKNILKCLSEHAPVAGPIPEADLNELRQQNERLEALQVKFQNLISSNRRTSDIRSAEELVNIAREALPEVSTHMASSVTIHVRESVIGILSDHMELAPESGVYSIAFEKEFVAGLAVRWRLKVVVS